MRKNTKYTQSKVKELEKQITVMRLWLLGHPIEFQNKNFPAGWFTPGEIDYEPPWNWDTTDYRIKPVSPLGEEHKIKAEDTPA